MHRVPVAREFVVRLVEHTAISRRVADQDRAGRVSRHRASRSLVHGFRHRRRLVDDQQYVLAVDTRESLWPVGRRRACRCERTLGRTLQRNPVAEHVEAVAQHRGQAVDLSLQLGEESVEQLPGGGCRHHGLLREARTHEPDYGPRAHSRLTDTVTGADADASATGGDLAQGVLLPLGRRLAQHVAHEADGVAAVECYEIVERRCCISTGHRCSPSGVAARPSV